MPSCGAPRGMLVSGDMSSGPRSLAAPKINLLRDSIVSRKPLIVTAVLFLGGAARAQQALPPLSIERLQLDASAVGSLALGSGELLLPGQLRASAAFHFEKNPLMLLRDGQPYGSVVRERVTVHAAVAYALSERFEVSFQLPLVPSQRGDDLGVAGLASAATSGAAQPWAALRAGLWRVEDGWPVDVAAELGLALPLGGRALLGTHAGLTFAPRLMASRRVGPMIFSAEVGTLLRRAVDLGSDRVGSQLDGGAAAALHIGERLRLELTARASAPFTGIPSALEALGGARFRIGGVELFALAGPGIERTPGTPAYRVLAGLALVTSPRRAPAGRPIPVRMSSAALESLPAVVVAPPVELAPAPAPPALVVEAYLPPPPLPDIDDEEEEEVVSGPRVAIQKERLELKGRVFFETNRARIRKRSYGLLDEVASVIRTHPELPPISIEGHTDDRGTLKTNRRLSLERARAVRRYLIKRGLDGGRLQTRGFGRDKPIHPNASKRTRAQNRRVEFRFTVAGSEHTTEAVEVMK